MPKPVSFWNRTLARFGLKPKNKAYKPLSLSHREWKFEPLEQRQLLSVATWTGQGVNNNWATAANWSGGVAPQAGDDLCFAGSLRTSTQNNLTAGLSFHSIEFQSNNFSLAGNSITLSSGITVDQGVTGSSISLAGIGLQGAVNVNAVNTSMTISGSISGSGSLTKTGNGTLILTNADTYSGGTTITAGSCSWEAAAQAAVSWAT